MLKEKNLGVAAGIIWAASMFVCTVLAIYTSYASDFLWIMKSIYPGFTISWSGAFLGLIYGFVDAFIFFWLLAFVYNKIDAPKKRNRSR